MRFKIDRAGALHIERGDTMTEQKCPFVDVLPPSEEDVPGENYPDEDNYVPCGHWCPLFGEPQKGDLLQQSSMQGAPPVKVGEIHGLQLCKVQLKGDLVADERPQPKEEGESGIVI